MPRFCNSFTTNVCHIEYQSRSVMMMETIVFRLYLEPRGFGFNRPAQIHRKPQVSLPMIPIPISFTFKPVYLTSQWFWNRYNIGAADRILLKRLISQYTAVYGIRIFYIAVNRITIYSLYLPRYSCSAVFKMYLMKCYVIRL